MMLDYQLDASSKKPVIDIVNIFYNIYNAQSSNFKLFLSNFSSSNLLIDILEQSNIVKIKEILPESEMLLLLKSYINWGSVPAWDKLIRAIFGANTGVVFTWLNDVKFAANIEIILKNYSDIPFVLQQDTDNFIVTEDGNNLVIQETILNNKNFYKQFLESLSPMGFFVNIDIKITSI